MSLPLPDLENRALSADAFEPIALFHTGRLSALAVGPGMGRHPSTRKLVRRILDEIPVPTVLDADGLHAFSGAADLLRLAAAGSGLVLTPHPGEFSSLTGVPLDDLLLDRFASASHWARRLESVLVLKGAPTLIADPTGETVYVNPTGSEALATGGTGDVLTGFIAGFLAQGVDPVDAATAGAFIHGLIADYLVEEWGSPYGLQAGDLIEGFPAALGELLG
jgi:NAD(P)H-hydrate epimerase